MQEKAAVILPKLVKRFFSEKEVTSSLVMDALFVGCKLLEAATAAKAHAPAQVVFIDAKRGLFYLQGDALHLWSCATFDASPTAAKLVRHYASLLTAPLCCASFCAHSTHRVCRTRSWASAARARWR